MEEKNNVSVSSSPQWIKKEKEKKTYDSFTAPRVSLHLPAAQGVQVCPTPVSFVTKPSRSEYRPMLHFWHASAEDVFCTSFPCVPRGHD